MNNSSPHNQGIAAVLSFFFPGVGQIYKGQIGRGVFYFMIVSMLYASGVFIPVAALFHIFIIFGAYQSPKKKRVYVDQKTFNNTLD